MIIKFYDDDDFSVLYFASYLSSALFSLIFDISGLIRNEQEKNESRTNDLSWKSNKYVMPSLLVRRHSKTVLFVHIKFSAISL